jgi:hypothetical protein
LIYKVFRKIDLYSCLTCAGIYDLIRWWGNYSGIKNGTDLPQKEVPTGRSLWPSFLKLQTHLNCGIAVSAMLAFITKSDRVASYKDAPFATNLLGEQAAKL